MARRTHQTWVDGFPSARRPGCSAKLKDLHGGGPVQISSIVADASTVYPDASTRSPCQGGNAKRDFLRLAAPLWYAAFSALRSFWALSRAGRTRARGVDQAVLTSVSGHWPSPLVVRRSARWRTLVLIER